MKVKWRSSLQAKYLVLIIVALFVFPFTIPVISGLVYVPAVMIEQPDDPYGNHESFEEHWHEQADGLSMETDRGVIDELEKLHEDMPEAGLFWVGENGGVKGRWNVLTDIPEQWSQSFTVQFMKEHYDSNPFTVVASVGEEGARGWIVAQIDREHLGPPITKLSRSYDFVIIIVIGVLVIGFGVLSWLFFKKVHGRLKQLKVAMDQRGDAGLPSPVERTSNDEIGELEVSFNQMVKELVESRKREQQEEAIRREWMASLSHDLRTPLTTIRASLAEVTDEVSSRKGQQAIQSMNDKIDSLSYLIDNLLSLSLLTSQKYPYHEQDVDMNRFVRQVSAHWYATFEQTEIEVDIDIGSTPVQWQVDPKWMERIMDNLFQNVWRHAAIGKYVGVSVQPSMLKIADRGKGMAHTSNAEGAGVGLSIVDIMIREMGMEWEMDSSGDGTEVIIHYNKEPNRQERLA
ncbi:HAMP domain-containing histidine kinase [Halobacillus locisalis]|uniref:histidine kinase n=1 Tax=Halobacillus locisalis TaxID=220753 RepID=A0A838CT81_9BACI|nr:HAMP domain-containing sensor histidine kinase [Halobacillus locisalis]MBA2175210.1 HAMP domain-containing histidine kinase [Halobacillus locisalis]